MPNPFTRAREAIWQFIDADAALSAFLAEREAALYRFDDGDNLPMRLAADDCPALAVCPRGGDVDWESASSHALLYRIEIRGWTAGGGPAEIEQLAWLVYGALKSGLPDMGLSAVEGVDYAGPSFAAGERFCSFSLGLVMRICEPL